LWSVDHNLVEVARDFGIAYTSSRI
jgi:hypothetical protein